MNTQLEQYIQVRNLAGAWLRTEVAMISVEGPDRFTWLQGMLSNDMRLLASGSTGRLPACILDATGHVLADVQVTALPNSESALLEVPTAQQPDLLELLDRYIIMEDVSLSASDLAVVTLQGPGAESLLQAATQSGLSEYHAFPADHTGSGGFDLCADRGEAIGLLDALVQAGAATVNETLAELLRIEAGIPLYGKELDRSVIALEAGFGSSHISSTKGCYVGQEIIARIMSRGHTNRILGGLVLTQGGVAEIQPGARLYAANDGNKENNGLRETGRITSIATSAPSAGGKPIALAYLRHEHSNPGQELIVGEQANATAVVQALPFYHA